MAGPFGLVEQHLPHSLVGEMARRRLREVVSVLPASLSSCLYIECRPNDSNNTDLIADITGERPGFAIEPWRPADQRYYVSSTAKFERLTGWRPRVGVRQGVERLLSWLVASRTPQLAAANASKVAS